jgi:hypothetical protein
MIAVVHRIAREAAPRLAEEFEETGEERAAAAASPRPALQPLRVARAAGSE